MVISYTFQTIPSHCVKVENANQTSAGNRNLNLIPFLLSILRLKHKKENSTESDLSILAYQTCNLSLHLLANMDIFSCLKLLTPHSRHNKVTNARQTRDTFMFYFAFLYLEDHFYYKSCCGQFCTYWTCLHLYVSLSFKCCISSSYCFSNWGFVSYRLRERCYILPTFFRYGLSVVAQPSDPVQNLLFRAGVLPPPPMVAM